MAGSTDPPSLLSHNSDGSPAEHPIPPCPQHDSDFQSPCCSLHRILDIQPRTQARATFSDTMTMTPAVHEENQNEPEQPDIPPPSSLRVSRQDNPGVASFTIDIDDALIDDQRLQNKLLHHLAQAAVQALPHADISLARLDVRLLDDAGMACLNEQHLGIPSPTDVLCFPSRGEGGSLEVDIALDIDAAEREATSRGEDLGMELLRYLLHGILHCAGFDDRDEATTASMHAEEDRLLALSGMCVSGNGETTGEIRS